MFQGEKLKHLRTQNKLSQRALGDILHTSAATINRYEKGLRQPKPDLILKLADYFNVSTDYLLKKTYYEIEGTIPEEAVVHPEDLDEYQTIMKSVLTFFMNDHVAEEDKEAIFQVITEMFWEFKKTNRKKTPVDLNTLIKKASREGE